MSLINKWDSKLNKIMRRVSNRSQIFIVWLLLILFLQGLTDYILFLFNVRNAAAMSSLVTLFLSITGFFGFRSIQIANLTLNSFELIQNKNNSYKFDFSKNELTFWIINTGNHINNYSFLGIYQLSDNESIDHFENNLETNKLFSSNHWLKIHADKVSLIPLMPNESSKLITIEFTTTLDANQKYLLIFTDSQKRIYDFQLSSLENHCNH
jgi:hypothetical protein